MTAAAGPGLLPGACIWQGSRRTMGRGKVPVSASCMLEHYAEYRDAQAVVHNVVELDASGRVKILYPGK